MMDRVLEAITGTKNPVKVDQAQFALIPESQFGRITLLAMAGGGVYAFAALWPWRVLIGAVILLLVLSYTGVRVYMMYSMHQFELEQKRASMLPAVMPVADEPIREVARPMREQKTAFSEMIGTVLKSGGPFVLSYDQEGLPITMSRLTSLGIGGYPGSGKTVTTLVIMLEAIIKYNGKIKFLVVDPHMEVEGDESLVSKIEALSPFFLTLGDVRSTVAPDDHDYLALLNRIALFNPLSGGEELRLWMQVIDMELQRRLVGKTGDTWVIVMDEYAALMTRDQAVARSVASVIEQINNQARKMNMFSLLISQNWKVSRTGSSELRDSIATFVLHQMPQSVAKLITTDDVAPKVAKLKRGEMILTFNGEEKRGMVPYADESDAETVLALYRPQTSMLLPVSVEEDWEEPDEKTQALIAAPSVRLPDEFLRVEMEEVRRLYASGLSEKSIAQKVFGGKSGPELEEGIIQVRKRLNWMVENVKWN